MITIKQLKKYNFDNIEEFIKKEGGNLDHLKAINEETKTFTNFQEEYEIKIKDFDKMLNNMIRRIMLNYTSQYFLNVTNF